MTPKFADQTDLFHSCEVCLAEVPTSVGAGLEGREYVHYFFGPECFALWENCEKEKTIDHPENAVVT